MPTELPQNRSRPSSRHVPSASHSITAPRRTNPAQPPKNRLGAAGITFALVGLVLSLVPLVGPNNTLLLVLGVVSAVPGIVISVAGLLKARRTQVGNSGVPIVAIMLSVIAVALCVTWFTQAKMASGASGLHIPAVVGDRHTVEFSVTSTGGATVRYGALSNQHTQTSMPSTDAWKQKASYNKGSYSLTLSADNTSASLSNTITCSMTVDGRQVAQNSGSTIALCTATVG
jgi:hypothetical protein